jgi:glycosyltransferase involved in cell wall biosynthesis
MQTVVILICTSNRPSYLDELLTALTHEVSSASCKTLSVVVIDNGTQDVRSVVEAFRSALPVEYVRLPGSGLVGARNRSLRTGLRHEPDYLVFIDDDEVPQPGWLDGLLSTMSTSGADFAVGPVNPKFSQTPPSWAPEFFTKSGEDFCTSNLIIRASVVPRDEGQWFQPRFSATGGEDGDFLRRLANLGATHAVARSAFVLENIPSGRVTARYLWRRGFRDGVVVAMSRPNNTYGGLCSNILLALRKIGYGSNHLVWSIATPERFYRAVDDLSLGWGIIFGSAGVTSKFY